MSIYRDAVRNNPDKSLEELADLLEQSNKTDAERRSIKQCLRRAMRQLDDEDLYEEKPPEDVEIQSRDRDGDYYKMDDDERVYVFHIVHKDRTVPITLPYAVVQSIFEWYTDPHGLTIGSTVRKLNQVYGDEGIPGIHKLTERYFRRIKETLGLTHKKMPFAPHMHKEHNEDELERKYLETLEAKLETKLKSSERKHWRKKYEEERKKSLTVEMFFDRLEEEIEKPEFPDVEPVTLDAPLEPTDLILHVGDWHVGAVVDLDHFQYNYRVFRERLQNLKREIREYFLSNQRPVRNIYICDVGDSTDGVMGDLHPEQALDQDLHGVEQIKEAAVGLAELADFVEQLAPDADVECIKVGGNHDRVKQYYQADPQRLAAGMTMELAQEYSEEVDKWIYESGVIYDFRIGPTQIFVTHGDRSPSNFRDIVHSQADRDAKYYLVLLGHEHRLELQEDLNIMKAVCGSLVGTTDYTLEYLGHAPSASQSLIEVRPEGRPRPLKWLPVD